MPLKSRRDCTSSPKRCALARATASMVVVAILALVLHCTAPGLTAADRGPEVAEGFLGRVGVAYPLVRLTNQFFSREAADFDEAAVEVPDATLQEMEIRVV